MTLKVQSPGTYVPERNYGQRFMAEDAIMFAQGNKYCNLRQKRLHFMVVRYNPLINPPM